MIINPEHLNEIICNLQDAHESESLEFKAASDGNLPGSLWDTYSSFANTNGGLIILGIKEKNNQLFGGNLTDDDLDKLQKDLWALLNNRTKVSVNLLRNDDVSVIESDGVKALAIRVPRASLDQRPVHIGPDPYNGTFRRGYEGDFKCNRTEVQRMFAEADMTRTNDRRILKGYTMDDIDRQSLHQYRQLFNASKPDHVWATFDDFEFLKQLGAWRKDRTQGGEGFTVAGILMFGKNDTMTDDQCSPAFFPDYRDESSALGNQRWIDRLYPDGTWEANLFQFYLRALPRIQSHLPKPFMLEGNNRIDQSPAHVAIREAFINLIVHADYRGEGSLKVIYSNGSFLFSNPGTLLVSTEQFFEGGESICRNPTIQKMFMLLGPAEKAGSGGAKIISGWRSSNWKTPSIFQRIRPDKVEVSLNMQSLIQPEIVERLSSALNYNISSLNPEQQTVLAVALTEKQITNERLRHLLNLHKADITLLLQGLCLKGLLESEGYGRATRYALPEIIAASSNQKVDTSEAKVDTLEAKVDTSGAKVDTLEFSHTTRELLGKSKLSKSQVLEVLDEIAHDWISVSNLAVIMHKDVSYLKNKLIPRLINEGAIEREYPTIPNHPAQRYRRVAK